MSNENQSGNEILNQKKAAYDYLQTAIRILTTRVTFYHEEFRGVLNTVEFLAGMANQIQKDIEAEEPKKEEAKKPYVIDVPAGLGADNEGAPV